MAHVLHLSSELPPQRVYGLGRYVQELSEAQAANGDRVEIITNSLGGEEFELVRSGVTIQRVHFPPPPKSPTTASTLLHFNMQLVERAIESRIEGLRETNTVINSHDWLTTPAAFHLGRLMNRPVVTTFHDVIFNKVRGKPLSAEDEHVANLENWACHFSAKIIVLSETVKKELITHYHADPSRIAVIPGGVGIKSLTAQDFPSISAWRRRHAADHECLLLYAGRLDQEKGIPTLLEATVRLKRIKISDWKLVIAGNGLMEDWLKQFIADRGLQSFVGRTGYLDQQELRLAYGAADAVIVPSYYEPFGLVALEAQKLATPVIVSKTGGLSETIARTGGGLAFPAGNSEALAECMKRMVDDPHLRKDLGLRGKSRVSDFYEWSSIARTLDTIFDSISGAPAPQPINVPAWVLTHPNGIESKTQPLKRKPGEPLSSLTLFWDSATLEEAIPPLQCLCELHAIKSLNGKVNLVPVILNGKEPANLSIPFVHPRFNLVKLDGSVSDFKPLLTSSAGIIVQTAIMPAIEQSRLLQKGQWPIIGYGHSHGFDEGVCAANIEELYALGNKLLCDDRLRSSLAPEIEQGIPQVQWLPPRREKPFVLHILPQLVTGGAETMLLALVKSSQDRIEHRILCLGPLEGFLPREFEVAGVRIDDLSVATPSKAIEFISSLRPDLIHLHSMSYVPSWIPIHRRLANAKIIETEHVVNIGSGHFGPVDKVACVSQSTLNPHIRYLPILGPSGPDFQVIYNGIDTDAYSNLPTKEEARASLNLPPDRPIIGRVSALARNKLPREALEVIPLIKERIPSAFFVIVGDGPQRKDAEAWVSRNGLESSVSFLGERGDIPSILPAFDVFAYYTTKEAFGNVIVEAVAAGIPVVTTDVEGTREALGQAPGTLVRLNDHHAFASTVAEWVKRAASPPERHVIPSVFTQKDMAEKYVEVYQSTLSSNEKPRITVDIPEGGLPEKITVLMPAFNSDKGYMTEALHSLSIQSFSNWELLIVNDGSDPAWRSWVENLVEADMRLKTKTRIIHLLSNQGVAAALNAGLDAARTELIARMDSDDRLLPERLALQVATFKSKPHLSLVGGWARLISAQGTPLPGRFIYPNAHRHLLNMLGSSCAFAHPSVMYRKSAIKAVGGYRPECRHYEDYDLWVRLASAGHLFENLPLYLIEYRLHEHSISNAHRDKQARGSRDCAGRARTLIGDRTQTRKAKVIFTGVHHSYGKAGSRLSDEQFFFARALQHMPQLEVMLLPADLLIRKYGQSGAGERLCKVAEDRDADLIFTVLGNPELDYLPEHIRRLTERGILTLNWNCDDHWRFPHTSKWAPNYSHMATTDPIVFGARSAEFILAHGGAAVRRCNVGRVNETRE